MNELNHIKELSYGAISGMIGKVIEFPFDTIKVRLQSTNTSSSTLNMIKSTYKNEGIIGGFYQGLKAPLIGACLENAVLFSSYNASLNVLHRNFGEDNENIDLKFKALSGGISGIMISFILTPIELIKCQLQVKNLIRTTNENHQIKLNSLYSSTIREIIKKDGIKGLWKGLGSTLLREFNGTMIWFSTYEIVSEYLSQFKSVTPLIPLISGATAGVTFNFIIFPIDTIKSNIQTNDVLRQNEKTNAIHIIKRLGIRNLYSGLTITLIRSLPANTMIFYTYESLKRNF